VQIQSTADSDNGNSMIAMVMMVIMIALVMGIIVPEALRQIASVHDH
jgi:competence protein ComGC